MKHHPTTDETEAGIVLTIWGAIFVAGACTGAVLGAVVCIFDCLMLGVVLAASSKLERKDKHLKTSRARLRKESNRE